MLPRLARSGKSWVAAFDQPGASGATRTILWRDGRAEVIGEGDRFEPVDLVCSGVTCGLLTTHLGKVAAPGATVWRGVASEPAERWRPVELAPSAPDSDARPLCLTGLEGAALLEKGEVVFFEVTAAGSKETDRIAAPYGALDAISTPRALLMSQASPVGDDGCSSESKPGIRFLAAGGTPREYRMPAPPIQGVLRRLAHGAVAVWSTLVGCRGERRVVYALVLDAQGTPAGAPVPVGDAGSFAVATQGDQVDIFLQEAASVLWLRADCAPP